MSKNGAGAFLSDVTELRRRAREHIELGAVTPSYKGDVRRTIDVLNTALATEIVCVLRYKRHYFMATGIDSEGPKQQFLEHATQEQQHADMIANRITQLGGEPNLDPAGLATRSHSQYAPGTTLTEMIREDLIAERIAIESYREIIHFLGENDPTSRRMMEEILAVEEEHANDMNDLLATYEKAPAARN
jgi:bacterioferritin